MPHVNLDEAGNITAIFGGAQEYSIEIPDDDPRLVAFNNRMQRDQAKRDRATAVEAITVTVNSKVFDGDETSQERMARALRVADITGQTSCTWVLHDNSAVTVTKGELAQALAMAMQAQAAIWVTPG